MAIGYSLVILIRVMLNLSRAHQIENITWKERFHSLAVDLLPSGMIMLLMIVFILFGITTPTEAAAVGFVASVIVVACYGCLKWEVIKDGNRPHGDHGMLFLSPLPPMPTASCSPIPRFHRAS